MEAEAKITLDATGFESGAQRVGRASKQMAADSADSAAKIGKSLKAAADDSGRGSERIASGMRGAGLALRAARGEAGALHFALLEIAQSAKLSTVGVLGIGFAAEGIETVTSAAVEAHKALKDATAARVGFIGGKNTSPETYAKQLDVLFQKGQQVDAASESFVSRYGEKLADIATSAIDALVPSKGGRNTSEVLGISVNADDEQKARDDEKAANQKAIVEMSGQLAEHQRKVNDLSEEGTRIGERGVAVGRLELEQKEKINSLQRAGSEKGFNSMPQEAELNREYELRKKLARIADETEGQQRYYRSARSDVQTVHDLPGDAEQKYGNTKSAQMRNIDYTEALQAQQTALDNHLDTADADQKVRDTKNALDEELRSLSERGKELDGQTKIQALQLSGQRIAASNASALLAIENRITAAINERNGPLQQQLETQRDQLKTAQALAAFLHPQQAEAERREGRAYDQAVARMNESAGLVNVSRGASGQIEGGTDALTGEQRYIGEFEPGRARVRMLPPKPKKPSTAPKNSVAGGPELIPDNADIPDYPGTADLFSVPRNLAEAEAMNGRPESSVRVRDLLSPEQKYRAIPHGLDAIRDAPGAAEQNRPSAPQDSGQQGVIAVLTTVQSTLAAIQASISGFSSQITTH